MEIIEQDRVAARIRQIMRSLGLTQTGLAGALGITQPAVSKYLNDRIPPAELCYKISRLGGVSMEWLLTGSDVSLSGRVAESSAGYGLQERINRLPRTVQEALLVLVNRLNETE